MKCSTNRSNNLSNICNFLPTIPFPLLLLLFFQSFPPTLTQKLEVQEEEQQQPPLTRRLVANGIIVLPLIKNSEIAPAITSTVALPKQQESSIPEVPVSLELCFSHLDNFALRGAVAYEVFEGFEVLQCAERCIRAQKSFGFELNCRSFVFEVDPNVCLFYETSTKNSPAELVWKPKTQYHQLRTDCSYLKLQSRLQSYQIQQPVSQSQPTPANCELCDNEAFVITQTTPTVTPLVPTTTMQFLRISDCPMGLTATMEKVSGKEIPNPTAATIAGLTEKECLALCIRNRLSDGFPILCRSFNYLTSGGQCSLSTTTSAPGRKNILVDNSNAVHYEKLCLPRSAATKCGSSYVERFPQKQLIGFNQKLERVANYEKCVEICLDSQVLYGFICRSGMYYSDSSDNSTNCVMNFESAKSEPELFINEVSQSVEYFDVTNCNIPERSKDSRSKTG